MSGHSHWATIKRQKGASDAKRGQLFTKLAREITVAARQGGNNPDMNVRLRLAVLKGRENNMPLDNIERAIKRGAGGADAGQDSLDETTYEGYGPGGVAIMLHALTDNRNRITPEIRSTFSKGGGSLGEMGCVSWNFEQRGVITSETENESGEEVALASIDAGAEDFQLDGTYLEIYASPEHFDQLRVVIEHLGAKVLSAEISMVPKSTVLLDNKSAQQTLKLLDQLEDLDDVQKVYTNADFPIEALDQYRKVS